MDAKPNRIAELEDFVATGDRGSTLELPYDSAKELLEEVRTVTTGPLIAGSLPATG